VGEELIVTIRVGTLNYGEVFAVVTERGLFVNPEEVIAVMDFPISKVPSDRGLQLKGWYISENRTFELSLYDEQRNIGVGEVTIIGDTTYIPEGKYAFINGESLIDFDLVGSWFGFSLSFDSESLAVNVAAAIPLPAQERLKREKKDINAREHAISKYPNFDFGYYERSHQMLDANLTSTYRNEELTSFYSVVGIQDLAGYSTRFFVRGDDEDIFRSANINFKRQSLQENLLGPLKASTIQFGDIRPTRIGGVTGGESVGVNINNQKLGQPFDFEFTDITGVIQDGWDVELYQNGVLTRKIIGTNGGQYEFLDLPLFANLNTFEVVKYGPQGQVQRERYERNLDADIFNQKVRYNVSLTRSNTSLLNESTADSEDQDIFLSGAYSYSFLGWLSTRFSHNLNLTDSTGTYGLGATARINPRLLSTINLSSSGSDQYTASASLQSQLFNQFLNIRASRSHNGDGGESDTVSLRMSGNIYQGDIFRLSYNNSLVGNWLANSNSTINLSNTLTLSSRYGFLSHNFGFVERNIGDLEERDKIGGVTFGTTQGNFFTRLNANYEIDEIDGFDWLGAEASLNYEFYNDLSTQLKINRSFDTGVNNYQWSMQWQQPSYAIFSTLSYNSNDDVAVSLNARFSLSEAPFGKGYVSSHLPLTSNGLVAVRLYHDVNQNFIFDSEDTVLPNVKVAADQLTRFAESDEYGIAIFDGIGSFRQTDLTVDTETIDDPYLLQSTENTSLTPREGLLTLINYPFIEGIEFEGELKVILPGGEPKALRSAPINIYRSSGELVKTIKTEFDGYFYSDVMFPDSYELRVSPEYLQKNELVIGQRFIVNAKKAGSFVPDIQLTAQKLPFRDQYQTYIAALSFEPTAKAYLKMVQKKFSASGIQFTLHKNNAENKYFVGIGHFDESEEAQVFCERYIDLFPSCAVRKERFIEVAVR
jgi:hypothetical protein